MAIRSGWLKLLGSEASKVIGHLDRGDRNARMEVTVVVASPTLDSALFHEADRRGLQLPGERDPAPSFEDFVARHGARQEAIDRVVAFAKEEGLEVLETDAARCAVELGGTVDKMSDAFQAKLRWGLFHGEECWIRDGAVHVPEELDGVIQDVLGLDQRSISMPRAIPDAEWVEDKAEVAAAEPTFLRFRDPREVAALYGFPKGTGKGQSIAILQFGGGWWDVDNEAYFALRDLALPPIELTELLGARNQPVDRDTVLQCGRHYGLLKSTKDEPACNDSTGFWATVECTLDGQLIGTVVPEATMKVYMAPNTERGQYAAYSRALLAPEAPTALNASWGGCENKTSDQFMRTMNRLFARAVLRDISVCVSAGDYGDGQLMCGEKTGHCPATSPYVLACGGSSLKESIEEQTYWSETIKGFTLSGGGGHSGLFDRPSWQDGATSNPKRGFPDVVSKADILGGYDSLVAGVDLPMGGSSAAAPMWAALTLLLREHLGHAPGYFTPLLYDSRFADATYDITRGAGDCQPNPGWDTCTGLGSPQGEALLAALRGDGTAADEAS